MTARRSGIGRPGASQGLPEEYGLVGDMTLGCLWHPKAKGFKRNEVWLSATLGSCQKLLRSKLRLLDSLEGRLSFGCQGNFVVFAGREQWLRRELRCVWSWWRQPKTKGLKPNEVWLAGGWKDFVVVGWEWSGLEGEEGWQGKAKAKDCFLYI